MNKTVSTLLKLTVSLGLVFFLFSRVPGANVVMALAQASSRPLWLSAAVVIYLAAICMTTVKWAILLRAQGLQASLRDLLAHTFIGVFFSNFLPAGVGGDVMRGYGLAQDTEQTAAAAVSVLVDRIVGLIAFVSTAVLASVIALLEGRSDLRPVALIAIATFVLIGGGFALLLSQRTRSLLERLFQIRFLARFHPLYSKLSDTLGKYRFRYRALLLAYLAGLGVVMLSNVVNWMMAQAVEPGSIPFADVMLFNPLVALAQIVPLSIGGLGINQTAFVFFYGLAGIPERVTLPTSLLMQLTVYVTSLPGGMLWLRGRRLVKVPPAHTLQKPV